MKLSLHRWRAPRRRVGDDAGPAGDTGVRTPGDDERRPGRLRAVAARFAARLAAVAGAIAWQQTGGAMDHLRPEGRGGGGPLGRPGAAAGHKAAGAGRASARAAGTVLRDLTTIVLADRSIRVLVTRGNHVVAWAGADLPPGIVDDGAVRDPARFSRALGSVIASMAPGSRLRRRRAALVVSGRNTVQGRFVLLDNGEGDMDRMVRSVAAERLSITPSDVQLDWDARPLDPVQDGDAAAAYDDPDEAREPHEVYALGIFKNVLESNLRPLRQAGMATVTVAPKSLALAAAAGQEAAVIVDVERDAVSVVVTRAGLPEVVRDMRSGDDLSAEQWSRALAAHVERTVEFHDMLNPDDAVGPETPVFVTGRPADVARVEAALREWRFNVTAVPAVLGAPDGFPYAEMAACTGLVLLRGKRPWQRAHAPSIDRPAFRFVPPAYEPRRIPVKPVAASAAAAALAFGVYAGYGQVSDVHAETDRAKQQLTALERRLDLRSDSIRNYVREQAEVESVRAEAEAVLNASEAIRGRNGGFALTLDAVVARTPAGVSLDEVDDDGTIVVVRASAATYDLLLDFARSLEMSGAVDAVRINAIGAGGARAPVTEPDLAGLFPGLFPEPDEADGDQPPVEPPRSGPSGRPTLTLELTR